MYICFNIKIMFLLKTKYSRGSGGAIDKLRPSEAPVAEENHVLNHALPQQFWGGGGGRGREGGRQNLTAMQALACRELESCLPSEKKADLACL